MFSGLPLKFCQKKTKKKGKGLWVAGFPALELNFVENRISVCTDKSDPSYLKKCYYFWHDL